MLAVTTVLTLWIAAQYQFGGVAYAIQYLQGYNYAVLPRTIDVGIGARGETRSAVLTVRNLSFAPMRVIGAITTCNCVAVTGLPLYIQPRQSVDVNVEIYLESAIVKVQQMAIIMIDDGHLQEVPVVITGEIREAQDANE